MKAISAFASKIIVALVFCINVCQAVGQTESTPNLDAREELIHSLPSRLAALARQVGDDNTNAQVAFWQEVKHVKCPIVEPIPGDSAHYRITFLWQGNAKTTGVGLSGGLPTKYQFAPLARLPGSDIWYLTQTYPADARFEYGFRLNCPKMTLSNWNEVRWTHLMQNDPFNPKEFDDSSYVELPEAPPQPWIKWQPDVPRGKLTRTNVMSQKLKTRYPVSIYTPPGYVKTGRHCWLMVAFDGGFPDMQVSLNNLLAARKIPPIIVVGINTPNTRGRDLTGSAEFADFIVNKVIPSIRHKYNVYRDASHTIVGGWSLGGLMAIYCGLHHFSVFGKVLALSPTLIKAPGQVHANPVWAAENPKLMTRQYATAPLLPVKVYVSMGRYETFMPFSMIYEARCFRDVLEAKGYAVGYSEYDGDHDNVCWRGEFADGLLFLTSP